ncbi:hypothetical protein [Pseudarthrobacter sp. S9]
MINIDSFFFNAEGRQGIALRGKVLLFHGHAGIANQYLGHAEQCAV